MFGCTTFAPAFERERHYRNVYNARFSEKGMRLARLSEIPTVQEMASKINLKIFTEKFGD